jgi:TolA-binding protein
MTEPTPTATEVASSGPEPKLVPVQESIKYRRRAQQAESRITELEQQLHDMQSQLDASSDELAQAEAQRDEGASQQAELSNRLAATQSLASAGVVDMETAMLLLAQRIDLAGDHDSGAMLHAVEDLLLDKPFLREVPAASLPAATATPAALAGAHLGQLADAAEQAIATGDRRDVAEYLRLRRQQRFI